MLRGTLNSAVWPVSGSIEARMIVSVLMLVRPAPPSPPSSRMLSRPVPSHIRGGIVIVVVLGGIVAAVGELAEGPSGVAVVLVSGGRSGGAAVAAEGGGVDDTKTVVIKSYCVTSRYPA